MQDHPIVGFQEVLHLQKAPIQTVKNCIKHLEQRDIKELQDVFPILGNAFLTKIFKCKQ